MDFEFFETVGSQVREIMLENPDQEEWFNTIIEEFENNHQFPDNTIDIIIDYLRSIGGETCNKLIDDIQQALNDDDNTDNLLSNIFFNDQDVEAFEEEEQPELIIEEEETKELDFSDPKVYFKDRIEKIMAPLNISYDLAYLILKKYNWNHSLVLNKWITSKDEVFQSLHLKFGSTQFPSPNSPITAQSCGKGECPIDLEIVPLLKLYCGHELCQNCLISEITTQIEGNKLPLCRQSCNAEIIPSDVFNLIKDPKILQQYHRLLLKSEIDTCSDAKLCPHCNILISSINDIGCHTGKCPQCHFSTCLRCQLSGSHAPLYDCEHINNFTIEIKNKMENLDEAQKLWYVREERLKDYRKQHQKDFLSYFDGLISKAIQKNKKLNKEDQDKINEYRKIANNKQKQLDSIRKSSSNAQEMLDEISKLNEEINNNLTLAKLCQKEYDFNTKDRDRFIKRLTKLRQLFIWSVTEERHKFQYGITKFKNKMNRLVSQELTSSINTENNIDQITKKCPKCHAEIYKQGGCNYVQCSICHYEFCWICNQAWVHPHGDHFFCPNYSLKNSNSKNHIINGIDYDDPKDMKFYPMPLDIDKMAEYIKWNNLYMEYKKNYDKYESLNTLFENQTNNGTRKLLIKALQKENSLETATELVTKYLNDILLAQSVVAWGYPQMFYMNDRDITYKLFEFKLFELSNHVDEVLNAVKCPKSIEGISSYFETNIQALTSMVNSILYT